MLRCYMKSRMLPKSMAKLGPMAKADSSREVKWRSVGDELRALRKNRGLRREDLAYLSKVSAATIGHIESGRSENPRLETLRSLAAALEVSLEDLAGNGYFRRKAA